MSSSADPPLTFHDKQDGTTGLENSNVQSTSHLDVSTIPPPLHRHGSYASTVSDITDSEYRPNDYTDGLLRRAVSNVSTFSNYSNAGPVDLRLRLRNLYYQNYGALLVLLSQVFGSIMNVSARLLEQPGAHGPPMHPFQILFARQTLTALLCTTYALGTKSIPDFPLGPRDRKVRLLLVSRGLCGFFGVFGMYFSLLYLPLSEATVLTFLAPILTCYLCSLLLPGETFTRQQLMAGIVSFVGVLFIARPTTFFSSSSLPSTAPGIDENLAQGNGTVPIGSDPLGDHDPNHPTPRQHLLAIGIAMIGVCGATGAMTSIRAIGTRAHALISVNYFSVWSAIVSLAALMIFPDVSFRLPGNITEWGLLFSLGICGFILQMLLTMGLAYSGPANDTNQKATVVGNNVVTQTCLGNKATRGDIEMQAQMISPLPASSSTQVSDSDPSFHPPGLLRSLSRSQPQPRKSKPIPHPSGNRATSMVYCQMLFALIADKIIFDTTLGVWSWIGSGLILSGAVWVAAAKDDSTAKKSKHGGASIVHGSEPDNGTDDHRNRHIAGKQSSSSYPRSRPSTLSRRESIPDGEGLMVTRTFSRENHGGIFGFGRKNPLLRSNSAALTSEEQVGLLGENTLDKDDGADAEWSSGSSSSSLSSPVSSSSDVSVVSPHTRPQR